MESTFGSVVAITITYIILFYRHKNIKTDPVTYIVMGLFLIYISMNVYNLSSGVFYYVTEDNI